MYQNPSFRKRVAALVLYTISLALVSCTIPPSGNSPIVVQDVVEHQTYTSLQTDRMWQDPQGGIGVGFVWPEYIGLHPDQRPQTTDVILQPGEDFDPLLILQASEPTNAIISVLLDYQQISFRLDEKVGLLHEIIIEPGVDMLLPIRVAVDTPGMHDLIVAVFTNPYDSSLDPEYRSSHRSVNVAGRRAAVVVGGDNTLPAKELKVSLFGQPVPEDVSLSLGIAFASAENKELHPSSPSRQLYVAKGKRGEDLDFQIWASNLKADQRATYTMMMFLDYHQVPINGNNVYLTLLDQGEEVIIDTSIQLPRIVGVHNLQIVYIFDPYKSIIKGEVLAPFVFASNRLGISVQR